MGIALFTQLVLSLGGGAATNAETYCCSRPSGLNPTYESKYVVFFQSCKCAQTREIKAAHANMKTLLHCHVKGLT